MSEDDEMLLAGEYALGSLDLAEMRDAEARAAREPGFAAEIAYWQDRLSTLSALVPPMQPPSALWSRLAIAIGHPDAPRKKSGAGFWKGTTAVSMALAAGFALFAFLPRPPGQNEEPARFAAALGPTATPARFLAETRPNGDIVVTSLDGAPAPAGRSFELWALPQGATVPVSLGILPPGQRVIRPNQRSSAQEQLLVSDEPAGGSPSGAPSGAVLFGGRLVPLSRAATPGQ